MKEKSYRKYFGFVAALLIFSAVLPAMPNPAFATTQDIATRLGGTNTGVYIPLYGLSMFPGALAAKQAFPNVPFQVNINPASGPGSGPDPTWTNTVTQLQAAGAVVTGYVATGYGNDAVSTVENEILEYHQWYPTLDGIMFDEVSGSCTQFSYYQTISNYVRSLGFSFIRANPGASICQQDVPLFDEIAIVESGGYPSESTLASSTFYPQYSKAVVGFGATLHGISSYDPTWLQMASKYIKWVYITDQQEPNPYTALPPYFNQYVSDLSAMATSSPGTGPTATVPSAPTGLAATDPLSVQVNLSWTAPSSNGGSSITGYQIQRSTDGGTTWSTIVPSTGSTGTTYSDTGVAASTAYTYQVSAINSVGTSVPSNPASVTTGSSSPSPTSGTPLGIIFPLYTYPGSEWTQIIQEKQAHPSVPTTVIINPSNGPGSGLDSNILTGVQQMQAAGIKVLGYVYTSYGGRSTSSAEADINSYNSWYHVDGIFFDEMTNAAGSESYYSTLSSYVKSHGMTYTMGNPGTSTLSSYVGTVDNLMIYESSGLPSLSTIISNTMGFPRSGFSFIAYGVSLPSQSYLAGMAPYISYVYITDAGGSNPYNVIPSYYNSLVSELGIIDGTSTPSTAPGSPTALTATAASPSQINLSWTAPANNGGSAITGYQIQRSSNGGSTWSTIVSNTGSTATTYSDTGLAAATTYAYQVLAINSVGTSAPSNTASATTATSTPTPTAPSAPSSLTATDPSSSQINLSWTAPSSNGGSTITGYNVYRGAAAGSESATPIATGITTTTFADSGVVQGSTYYYTVAAVNSAGTSPKSNEASATVATTGGTPSGGSTGSIKITNTQSTSGTASASPYQLTISSFGTGTYSNKMLVVGTSANSQKVASVTFGGTPLTRIISSFHNNDAEFWYLVNPSGTGNIVVTMSGATSAVVGAYAFAGVNPTSPIATNASNYNIAASSPSISLATKYAGDVVLDLPSIYGGQKLGLPTCTQEWNANIPSAITGASSFATVSSPSSATCSWTASNGGDLWDDVAVEVEAAPPTVSSAPANLTATAGNAQVSLSWAAPSSNGGSAITGYQIQRSSNGGSTWSTIVSNTGSTATTYSDTGLAAATAYAYQVLAINSVGTSAPSNTASATPTPVLTAPSAPSSLTATDPSSSHVNLSWTAPSSNGGSTITGYNVYRGAAAGNESATPIAAGVATTVYNDTSVTSGSTYYYTVAAVNSAGTSAKSNEASVIVSPTPTPPSQPQSTISVSSVDLSGKPITGMWTALSFANGTAITHGYTPVSFQVTSGNTYIVHVANYQNNIFNHWNNGNTTSNFTVTPTQNMALTAYYSTPVTITVNSAYVGGSTFTGQWVTLHASNGTIIASGYTPATFTVQSGLVYTVHASNYQSTIFNHWSDGTTNASLNITPTQNTALTAYFSNGMITINKVQTTSGSTTSAGALVLSGFSTATNPNSLLLVGVSSNNAGVSSVTFGGVPLIKAVKSFYNNDAEFWYLANPSGSGNIIVTMSGATSAVIGAYSLSGVNQTTPIATTASNHNLAASSPSVSITTTNPNDLVVDLPSIYGGVTLGTPTCTQQWDASMPGAITGASSTATVQSAGTTSCGWTASGSGDLWDDVAIDLKAAH